MTIYGVLYNTCKYKRTDLLDLRDLDPERLLLDPLYLLDPVGDPLRIDPPGGVLLRLGEGLNEML